jgi:hypothetical protein
MRLARPGGGLAPFRAVRDDLSTDGRHERRKSLISKIKMTPSGSNISIARGFNPGLKNPAIYIALAQEYILETESKCQQDGDGNKKQSGDCIVQGTGHETCAILGLGK